MSADERREQVIRAAISEFAVRGLDGATTADIAKRVGVSQPYLFRLFPNKKALCIAACRASMARTVAVMEAAAEGLAGEAALEAMGHAYGDMIETDREQLLMMLQEYAACHDHEIQTVVQECMGQVWEFVERASGMPLENRVVFFATGMLCNVVAAMGPAGTRDARWDSILDVLSRLKTSEITG
jgi:AcrR family transcriptional regulator